MNIKKQNRLGSILDRFFTSKSLSLHQAGVILGQHHTVLSCVTRGTSHLSRRNLEILLRQVVASAAALELSQADAFELAVAMHAAWLEEQILPIYEESLAVVRKGKPVSVHHLEPRSRAIAYLDKASKECPAIAEWLVATHQVMEQNTLHGEEVQTEQASRRTAKRKSS